MQISVNDSGGQVVAARQGRERVLVVDDSMVVRGMLGHFVAKAGHQLLTADSLAEVEELGPQLQEIPVAWVDVQLEGASGIDVAQVLHRHNPDMSIVVMSGSDDVELARTAEQMRAVFFVPKPITYPVFTLVLNNAIEVQAQRRQLRLARQLSELMTGVQAHLLRQAKMGQRPSLDMAFDLLFRTTRAITACNAAAIVLREGAGRWRSIFTRGFPVMWANRAIADDGGVFDAALADSQYLEPDAETVAANELLRTLRARRTILVPLTLPGSGKDMLIVLARPKTLGAISLSEHDALRLAIAAVRPTLDAMLAYRALYVGSHKTLKRLDASWYEMLDDTPAAASARHERVGAAALAS